VKSSRTPQGVAGFSRFRLFRSALVGIKRKQEGAIILKHLVNRLRACVRDSARQLCQLVFSAFGLANPGKFGPQQRAQWIGGGKTRARFIGARQAQLRSWMAFGGGAQIIFGAPRGINRATQTQRVYVAKEKFRLGVARICGGDQMGNRLVKLTSLKTLPCRDHIAHSRRADQTNQQGQRFHLMCLCVSVVFGAAAQAQQLPGPLEPSAFLQVDPALARLGQLLFYDPILSGNRNISCATCHSSEFGSADGMPLGLGEGGVGHGPARRAGDAGSAVRVRQSRNAPGLWNLGAKQVSRLFHDGRVEETPAGFATPAGAQLPPGLVSVLAAQALFPLISRREMAGDPTENPIADAAQVSAQKAWALIAARVSDNTEYSDLFQSVFGVGGVNIVHIANAIAAFVDVEFREFNTGFDRYLRGETGALSSQQQRGLGLFFGKANCSGCHSGTLLSDQAFHALAVPQFGPGRARRFDPIARDVGRMGVTDDLADAYAFRTPFLRNVARTAPYGHNGAFRDLRQMVVHHLAPIKSLRSWRPDQVDLPELPGAQIVDFAAYENRIEMERLVRAVRITPLRLSDGDIDDLLAFLHSLSGETDGQNRLGKPDKVPSGLDVE
jgi:cytochrome c peroxidase